MPWLPESIHSFIHSFITNFLLFIILIFFDDQVQVEFLIFFWRFQFLTFWFTAITNSKMDPPPKSLLQIRSKSARIKTRAEREHSVIDSHCTSQRFSRFEQFYFEFEAEILVVSFWGTNHRFSLRLWNPSTLTRPTWNRMEMERDELIGLQALRPVVLKILAHSTSTSPSIHEISDFQIFNFHKYSPTHRASNFLAGKLQQFPIPLL
jgi:hypothetical protein